MADLAVQDVYLVLKEVLGTPFIYLGNPQVAAAVAGFSPMGFSTALGPFTAHTFPS